MEEVKKHHTPNIPEENVHSEDEMRMDELLGPEVKVEEGKIIEVRVIGESPDGFLVDLGLKSEGLIPREELDTPNILSEIAVGAKIPVVVMRLHSPGGHPLVSYRKVREQGAWEKIVAAAKSGLPVEGTIHKQIKGGMLVDIGIAAFLPVSQIDVTFVKDPAKYIGKKLHFLITEASPAQKNVVLSRRKLLEIEQKKRRNERLTTLGEGQIVEGRVTGITEFGAFVDIGDIEGLLHISDLSWQRVDKVERVLKTGQRVKVQVLKIDREKEKVSLGMKQLSPHPWDNMAQRYPVDSVVKGKITSMTDFGIFVEVEPGIEGLLHISEVFWNGRKEDLRRTFSVGQELEVKVIAVDREKEKMSLSLKRIQPNPWEEARAHYPAGARVKGTVTHLTPFGAFVKLPEGIEGLIHISDMSWTKKVRQPQDVVTVGQEVEAVVLDVNPGNEKIALSLKHLSEDPFIKYRSGAVVKGTVKRIVDFGAFVELEPGVEGLVRLSELGLKKVESPAEVVSVDQVIEAKVIKSDPRERKIEISIRKLEHEQEKELLRKYVNVEKRPTLGEVLEEEE